MSDSGRVDTPPISERMTKTGFVTYLLSVSRQALERADAVGKANPQELCAIQAQHERQLAAVLSMLAEAVRSGLVVESRRDVAGGPAVPPALPAPPPMKLPWWRRIVVAIQVLRHGRVQGT